MELCCPQRRRILDLLVPASAQYSLPDFRGCRIIIDMGADFQSFALIAVMCENPRAESSTGSQVGTCADLEHPKINSGICRRPNSFELIEATHLENLSDTIDIEAGNF